MSYIKLLLAVKKMRKAQKEYFATRDREVLKKSKALENEVDALINQLETPNLFNS